MRTMLQEKETIHYSIFNLVHKFILMPQPIKIPAAKAAVDKEWEKLENSGVEPDESHDEGRKSSFCLTEGHLSFENCWVGGKAPKI